MSTKNELGDLIAKILMGEVKFEESDVIRLAGEIQLPFDALSFELDDKTRVKAINYSWKGKAFHSQEIDPPIDLFAGSRVHLEIKGTGRLPVYTSA